MSNLIYDGKHTQGVSNFFYPEGKVNPFEFGLRENLIIELGEFCHNETEILYPIDSYSYYMKNEIRFID